MTFYQPSSINTAAGSSLTYTISALNKTGSVYIVYGTTYTSTASSFTADITMAALKTLAGYDDADNGDQIKIKYTAANTYDVSDSSEVNLDEAVYQSVPAAYAGTSVASDVRKDTATISWPALTTAASYGHSSITGWKYGYKIGAGAFTFGTTTAETRTVTLPSLTSNTAYSFFVEPLNAYQLAADITDK